MVSDDLQTPQTSHSRKRRRSKTSRTFQNGLSDPDFRYRPRQFDERRGKYIKVEQTPCQGFSTSSGQRLRPIRAGEPVEEDRFGWEIVLEEFQPKRRGG
ncbi:hypothetical protein GEV33_004209 [Tenebrio molitor]|uniref:Uncharacterized protein n=1 Tax=Tenebrio molitor TaxID=7067 RepID=A0A8J6HQ80_TENMO|nr:hypothetical protein GEV33_004209 [Tenebrio molitor]